MIALIEYFLEYYIDFAIRSLGSYAVFIYRIIWLGIIRPPMWRLFREQLYNVGVCSFLVIAIAGFTTGVVLAAQSIFQLSDKGLAGVTGLLVGKSMVTELGPVLTSFMLTGRVGSAICAELGSMKVTEQIDALRSMAIDPFYYLVVPRFWAGLFMTPILSMASMLMGILGGYIVSTCLFQLPSNTYLDPLCAQLTSFDMFMGMLKSVVFGIMLISICCYKGMRVDGGAAGVGKATTQSVVISYILILIWDFLLTMGLTHIHSEWTWRHIG